MRLIAQYGYYVLIEYALVGSSVLTTFFFSQTFHYSTSFIAITGKSTMRFAQKHNYLLQLVYFFSQVLFSIIVKPNAPRHHAVIPMFVGVRQI